MDYKTLICSQCGANDFEDLGDKKIKCRYCMTVFKMKENIPDSPKVIISKGANVIFGKHSNVTIKGGVKIEDGAKVKFLGKLEIIEKGNEEKIKNSPYRKL